VQGKCVNFTQNDFWEWNLPQQLKRTYKKRSKYFTLSTAGTDTWYKAVTKQLNIENLCISFTSESAMIDPALFC
jgi:hypothetical protein